MGRDGHRWGSVPGATGWTEYDATGNVPLAMWDAQTRINDFKRIRVGEDHRRLVPQELARRSFATRQWLESKLAEPFAGKTVVFTHMAPSAQSLRKDGDHLGASFCNRWESLMLNYPVDIWAFGHTHLSEDFVIGNTRVISNQRGYPGEGTVFDPGFVIEV